MNSYYLNLKAFEFKVFEFEAFESLFWKWLLHNIDSSGFLFLRHLWLLQLLHYSQFWKLMFKMNIIAKMKDVICHSSCKSLKITFNYRHIGISHKKGISRSNTWRLSTVHLQMFDFSPLSIFKCAAAVPCAAATTVWWHETHGGVENAKFELKVWNVTKAAVQSTHIKMATAMK